MLHPDFLAKMGAVAEERFWSKVEKRGDDECWPWRGTIGTTKYGMFRTFGGSMRAASREAYEMLHGPLPDGVVVCHSCDNRICVNPRHLWTGSVADNNRDRHAKGRTVIPRGSDNPRATTSEDTVREIRRLKAQGVAQVEIAARCGVTQVVVSQILTGRTWKHLK